MWRFYDIHFFPLLHGNSSLLMSFLYHKSPFHSISKNERVKTQLFAYIFDKINVLYYFPRKEDLKWIFFPLFRLINITKTGTEKAGCILSYEKLMAFTFYKDRQKKTRDKKENINAKSTQCLRFFYF